MAYILIIWVYRLVLDTEASVWFETVHHSISPPFRPRSTPCSFPAASAYLHFSCCNCHARAFEMETKLMMKAIVMATIMQTQGNFRTTLSIASHRFFNTQSMHQNINTKACFVLKYSNISSLFIILLFGYFFCFTQFSHSCQ